MTSLNTCLKSSRRQLAGGANRAVTIEEDFEQLNEQLAEISAQVDAFQKAGREVCDLITEHTKKQKG